MLKQYVIGDLTANGLIYVLRYTKFIWKRGPYALVLQDFLNELKCQVE